MPIKPENAALYPPNWREIVAEIRARSGNCCEGSPAYPDCRVPHGAFRIKSVDAWTMNEDEAYALADCNADVARIVLTTGHRDHDPTNNGEPGNRPNLAHWCQRCHLTYDAKRHAQSAAQTRHKRKAIGELFS